MSLHIPTIALVATLVGVELALAMVVAAATLGRERGLGAWAVGATLLAVGGLSWGLLGLLPEWQVILLGNGLQFVGFALLRAGCLDFCDRPRSLRGLWVGLPLFLAGLLYFTTAMPSPRAWAIVSAVGIAPFSLGIAATLFRHTAAELRSTARIAGGSFLLHGLYLLLRIFLRQEGASTGDLLLQGWPQAVTVLEIFVGSIATMLALASLSTHRLVIEYARAARIDELTGLLNRRSLQEEGEKAVSLSSGMQLPCSVLFLDLDHFKAINDRHGHQVGDGALRHFAEMIAPALRRSDLLGRMGGEEFVVVMPGAGAPEALAVAERLRRLVEERPAVVGAATIPLTVSIGVAWGEDEPFGAMVARADEALYLAKGTGRNQVIEAAAMPSVACM